MHHCCYFLVPFAKLLFAFLLTVLFPYLVFFASRSNIQTKTQLGVSQNKTNSSWLACYPTHNLFAFILLLFALPFYFLVIVLSVSCVIFSSVPFVCNCCSFAFLNCSYKDGKRSQARMSIPNSHQRHWTIYHTELRCPFRRAQAVQT